MPFRVTIEAVFMIDTDVLPPEVRTRLLADYEPTALVPEPDEEWIAEEFVLSQLDACTGLDALTITDCWPISSVAYLAQTHRFA